MLSIHDERWFQLDPSGVRRLHDSPLILFGQR